MNVSDFSPHRRLRSFRHALHGLAYFVRSQPHALIHLLATVLVIRFAWWMKVTREEWMILVVAIGLVWIAEAMNTAVETLADAVHPGRNSTIGRAKDVAAAAVLISALVATVLGAFVFVPRF